MITPSVTVPAISSLTGTEGERMESDIFDVIESALARAGYKVLDGDASSIIIRHPNSDADYRISVVEEP